MKNLMQILTYINHFCKTNNIGIHSITLIRQESLNEVNGNTKLGLGKTEVVIEVETGKYGRSNSTLVIH